MIPPRLETVEDKERRFYVVAPSSVYLALQQEAIKRGTDLWTLGGSVLTAWLAAGCPADFCSDVSTVPAPSSSPIADQMGGAD